MKTPISYYGGKQQLVPKILPLIPEHRIYSEAFFGGGAVFFAKEPAKIEFINDTNKQVVNFYRVAKTQFKKLKAEIDLTLSSEEQYQQARAIYMNKTGSEQTDVLRAWALFLLSHQTYLHNLENTWSYSRDRNMAVTFQNKKEQFDERFIKRLERTQIFCRDANRVLLNSDDADSFHFIDPPYYNSDMGHYDGYTLDDFKSLLNTCENLKGKFLLTSYPSDILSEYTEKNGWFHIEFEMHKSASTKAGATKIEVFTMNYQPTEEQLSQIQK